MGIGLGVGIGGFTLLSMLLLVILLLRKVQRQRKKAHYNDDKPELAGHAVQPEQHCLELTCDTIHEMEDTTIPVEAEGNPAYYVENLEVIPGLTANENYQEQAESGWIKEHCGHTGSGKNTAVIDEHMKIEN